MRERILFVFLISLLLFNSITYALDLPEGTPLEFDLDNWTRLYNNGAPYPVGNTPVVGLESQAFITFNDISATDGPGGLDYPPFWIGGMNGEYLHGWEHNVVITLVVPQADGSTNIYFDHVTSDSADSQYWEVQVYQTGISTLDFLTNPSYIPAGPANFNSIANNIATNASSSLFLIGRFAKSTYFDPVVGPVIAVAGINIPDVSGQFLGGTWLNQVTTPFSLAVNAFIDVDPTIGVGNQFDGALYGTGPDGSDYDLAIQNVRLFSETDPNQWIISDDGVRGVTKSEEALPCRVTAGGVKDGITVPCKLKLNGMPDPKTCAEAGFDTWGGQAGAPPTIDGNWTHHHYVSSRKSFVFHSNDLFEIICSDPGCCVPACANAKNRQIDFKGIGRFTNKKGYSLPTGPLCFTVHLEDIGEPGPGGRWPSATDPCTHCPGTTINNTDCINCTDYYEIRIYGNEQCTGSPIYINGMPPDPVLCPGSPFVGYFTRSGNVQMHPDNNGP